MCPRVPTSADETRNQRLCTFYAFSEVDERDAAGLHIYEDVLPFHFEMREGFRVHEGHALNVLLHD